MSAALQAELSAQLPAMLTLLRTWVEMETPSAEPERVRALAEAVAAAFAEAGCRIRHEADSLQLEYPGDGSTSDPVLLLGHLDTVYPVGTLRSMPFRLEGGRAYGPGAFDMKAGVVQALFALRALRAQAAQHPPIRLLLVFDEEIGSPRSRPFTERCAASARAVLVLEPAGGREGKLKTGRKGVARYRLTAHGVAAHSGLDFERGASAIVELAARIGELAGWTDLERGVTVNPGVVAGGSAVNVVAPEARADIEARAWTAAELEAIDRRVRALRATDARVRLEIGGGTERPPMEPTPASEALCERACRIARELGFELGSTRVGGASDGNFTAALGRPTLDGLGAVGDGAHGCDEHVIIDQMPVRAALLAGLLCESWS